MAQQVNTAEMYPYISGILARTGDEVRVGGTVQDNQVFDSQETTTFNWDYGISNPKLRQLYERAKSAQWNGSDLPWDTDVDLEKPIFDVDPALAGADWFRKLDAKERQRITIEYNANQISQFVHGEQGALLAASQLTTAVPEADGKFYAASQTFDEARHVEVFSRYLREKLDNTYPCTQNLFNLIQAITVESRWDFKFLGMQLVVEGLAIAAFGNLLEHCHEPLFRQLVRMVLRDEARHVAFGVIALNEFYTHMNEAERRERQEFVYEACVLMRGRLVSGDAYERMGLDRKLVGETLLNSEDNWKFLGMLFSQIVPNMQRIGLLDGWLEERFAEWNVLQFKNYDADAVLQALINGADVDFGAAAQAAGQA